MSTKRQSQANSDDFPGKVSAEEVAANPPTEALSIPDDVTLTERVVSKDQLASVTSFDDALALMQEAYGVVTRSDEFGDGFNVLEDKMKLVGVPFAIIDSSLHESKEIMRDGKPAIFSVLRVMDKDSRKWVITDGSTGICEQIKEWRAKTGRRGGFVAMKGLRVSQYDYQDEKGNVTKASTFYLDESGV